jgi:hypothetical protein
MFKKSDNLFYSSSIYRIYNRRCFCIKWYTSTEKPASGVTVNLIDKNGKVIATGKTGDNGNVVGSGKTGADNVVTIPDVPTGTVHIMMPGYDSGDATANVTDGDTANAAVTATPIVGSLKVANINTATNTALPVPTVTVKDKDGKNVPIGDYTITVSDSSSMTIDSGKTSSVTMEGSRVPDSSLAGNTSGGSVPSILIGDSTNVISTISSASNIQSASGSSAEKELSSSNASALEN